MGLIRPLKPVCFFAGLLSADPAAADAALAQLVRRLGPCLPVTVEFDFDCYTDYYAAEMGNGLRRRFVAFRRPGRPDRLAPLKIFTNRLETGFRRGGARRVNIDPGWLDPARVVLASTKDFSHRVCVGSGIYAEVTMLVHGRRVETLPWTYPDYRGPEARAFFTGARAAAFPGRGDA